MYRLSKKLLYKMGHYFLDTQYIFIPAVYLFVSHTQSSTASEKIFPAKNLCPDTIQLYGLIDAWMKGRGTKTPTFQSELARYR